MLESFGGNIGVLAGDTGMLLVDAEWPQLYEKVVAAVRRISPQPIRYVINTHWHWDHVGGDSSFAQAGAVLFSSEQTRAHIVAEQKEKQSAGTLRSIPQRFRWSRSPHGTKFHLAGQTVEVIHVPPAHTDGDLIVRFVEADIIQTGDTFFHGFYPDIDQPHGGTIDGMIALYDTLYKMCGPQHEDHSRARARRERAKMCASTRECCAKCARGWPRPSPPARPRSSSSPPIPSMIWM